MEQVDILGGIKQLIADNNAKVVVEIQQLADKLASIAQAPTPEEIAEVEQSLRDLGENISGIVPDEPTGV